MPSRASTRKASPPGALTIVWSMRKLETKSIRCATFSSVGIGGKRLRGSAGSTTAISSVAFRLCRLAAVAKPAAPPPMIRIWCEIDMRVPLLNYIIVY